MIHEYDNERILNSINFIQSEYERRKEILHEEKEKQKNAVAITSKERKTEYKAAYNSAYNAKEYNTAYKKAYNAVYKEMVHAKIKIVEQLMNPKSVQDVNEELRLKEEKKRGKKREAERFR